MRPKRTRPDCGQGHLPDTAYLANPFVPFQMDDPPKYEAQKGLVRGTMFPGLDLPFHGKVNQKELNATPTTQMQAIQFAIADLSLYLDTHRNDRQALELYRTYQKLYQTCREQISAQHGPMNHLTPDTGECYRWLDDPWPWEYCGNKGV